MNGSEDRSDRWHLEQGHFCAAADRALVAGMDALLVAQDRVLDELVVDCE